MNRNGFALACLVLAVVVCVPASAAIAPDITLPIAGYLELPNDLSYRTEYSVTNHRDRQQYIAIEFVEEGTSMMQRTFTLEPHETVYFDDGGPGIYRPRPNRIGALRIIAADATGARTYIPDPEGKLEASGYIIADRLYGVHGSSRQEVEGIPSGQYFAREATFIGVRDDYFPTYTNVGITNLHPTQAVTFYVQFQYHDPIAVVVPPLSLRTVRVPALGLGGRHLRVYPEWSLTDGEPVNKTPWVAYTSTVDKVTGDAFSGKRIPADSTLKP
jgi:hypothetical protein